MVRYTGPRLRVIRRLGLLPGLTKKNPKHRLKTPGQHGQITYTKSKRSSLSDDYRERLLEKQKLRFNYGLSEHQLFAYYNEAKKRPGSTGLTLLELIESRLDCLIYRFGFAPTIPSARQLITHGHFWVNGQSVTLPSFLCKKGDLIQSNSNIKSKNLIASNYEAQEKRRDLIQKRMKKMNLTRSRFHTLLPKHLSIEGDELKGQILGPIKRKDVLVKINELKVVEYYSR
jgi:small subunit ribosomal protein S4